VTLVAVVAALLSATTETLQLFTIDRTTSVSDLVENTVGALGGAVASAVILEVSRRTIRSLWAHRFVEVSAFYPMIIATLLVCIAAWEPFDFTLDVGSLVGKVRALKADPWQFGFASHDGVALLRYLILGFAVSLWLRQLGVRAAGTMAAIAGTGAAVVLGCSQVLVESRRPGLKDVAVQAGGAIAGALLSRSWPGRRTPLFWYALFGLATFVAVTLQTLSPFRLVSTYHSFGWFPFFTYYEHTSSQVVGHVVDLMLNYLPFGFLLALALRGGRRLWLAATLTTLIVAWPLEYAQGWIEGRYPDITDVGMALLGALFGVWLGGPGRRLLTQGSAC
jgi:VanZ family protein